MTATAQKIRGQRHKLALIPLLVVILAFVVNDAMPSGSHSADEPLVGEASPPQESARDAVPGPESRNEASPRAAATAATVFPARELADILRYDPFHSPTPALTVPSEPSEMGVTETQSPQPLPSLTVQAVALGPQGPMALVDGQFVRVGDPIAPGYRVARIDANGISLERSAD